MKKIYNLKLEIDSPKYALTDEQFCESLKQVIVDELGDDIEYVINIIAECIDKDQQIAELKQQLEHYKGTKLEDYSNEIQELKKQLEEKDIEIKVINEDREFKGAMWTKFANRCKTLTIQLHTQPKEIVEKIKNFMDKNTCYYEEERFAEYISQYLDKLIKEL